MSSLNKALQVRYRQLDGDIIIATKRQRPYEEDAPGFPTLKPPNGLKDESGRVDGPKIEVTIAQEKENKSSSSSAESIIPSVPSNPVKQDSQLSSISPRVKRRKDGSCSSDRERSTPSQSGLSKTPTSASAVASNSHALNTAGKTKRNSNISSSRKSKSSATADAAVESNAAEGNEEISDLLSETPSFLVPRPEIRIKDLAGIDSVIKSIHELAFYPLEHPALYARLGVQPPCGILMHGPTGCGKTSLACAIAGDLGLPFFKVSAPELIGGTSGESEQRIRKLFESAAAAAPSVLFIDAIDVIAGKKENAQRNMDRRIIAQLQDSIDYIASLGRRTSINNDCNNINNNDGNSKNDEINRSSHIMDKSNVVHISHTSHASHTSQLSQARRMGGVLSVAVVDSDSDQSKGRGMTGGEAAKGDTGAFTSAGTLIRDPVHAPSSSILLIGAEGGRAQRAADAGEDEEGSESSRGDVSEYKLKQVILLAATNKPDSLDGGLRGRFSREIGLPVPDAPARTQILRLLTSNPVVMRLAPSVNLHVIGKNTPGFVGADLRALIREAGMRAVTRILSARSHASNTSSPPTTSNTTSNTTSHTTSSTTTMHTVLNATESRTAVATLSDQKMELENDNILNNSNSSSSSSSSVELETCPSKSVHGTESTGTIKDGCAGLCDHLSDAADVAQAQVGVNRAGLGPLSLVESLLPTTPAAAAAAAAAGARDFRYAAESASSAVTASGKAEGAGRLGVAVGGMLPTVENGFISDNANPEKMLCDDARTALLANKNSSSNNSDSTYTNNYNNNTNISNSNNGNNSDASGLGVIQRGGRDVEDDEFIEMADFEAAARSIQPTAKREGFAVAPDVTWDDVGALAEVREALVENVLKPISHPKRFKRLGLDVPAGVLFFGPPGCGKTLLAKALANESGANFISVKGPELLNMYVGESESRVRQVFSRARSSAPCVIFFDELDALCPRRGGMGAGAAAGGGGGEGGNNVSERVVNQLLTELDGLETRKDVYIIAATNRLELIDDAMLRPGRLGKLLYVPLPAASDRGAILRALTRKIAIELKTEVPVSELTESGLAMAVDASFGVGADSGEGEGTGVGCPAVSTGRGEIGRGGESGLRKEGEGNKTPEDAVDLLALAKDPRCEGFSGADLSALVREAGLAVLRELTSSLPSLSTDEGRERGREEGEEEEEEDEEVLKVRGRHFEEAFLRVRPSVAEHDRVRYERIHRNIKQGMGALQAIAQAQAQAQASFAAGSGSRSSSSHSRR